MAEKKRTETMIPQEKNREAVEVMGFMEILDSHEKKDLERKRSVTAPQPV